MNSSKIQGTSLNTTLCNLLHWQREILFCILVKWTLLLKYIQINQNLIKFNPNCIGKSILFPNQEFVEVGLKARIHYMTFEKISAVWTSISNMFWHFELMLEHILFSWGSLLCSIRTTWKCMILSRLMYVAQFFYVTIYKVWQVCDA